MNYVHIKTLDFNFGWVVHAQILVEVVKNDNKRQNSHIDEWTEYFRTTLFNEKKTV